MKKLFLPVIMAALVSAFLMVSCGAPANRDMSAKSESSSTDHAASTIASANPSGVRVSCIDVGKGDCILVQSGASSALIDTGYGRTANEVISYLKNQGVTHLDAIVLSHYDKDHVGGLSAIAEALGVDTVYLPGYEGSDNNYEGTMQAVKDLGLSARSVTEDVHLALGEAQLTVYPPGVAYDPHGKGEEGNDNDASSVATLTYGEDSYLFAGDLEEAGIDAYLRGKHGQFGVLKMPHHGAKSENNDAFLKKVKPKIALITDDVEDPASKNTLKLLEKRGAKTYCTSNDGTIVVESDGKGNYNVKADGN